MAAGLAVAAMSLTACQESSTSSPNNQGFVSGDGSFSMVKAADRKRPDAVSGTTLTGGHASLSALQGKVVVVNVWGSWCGPCRAEAAGLASAARALRPKGVAFLGINSRDTSVSTALTFQRNHDVPYPSIYDPDGAKLLAFRSTLSLNSIPSTAILDAQGRVAASVSGPVSRTTLEDVVEDVLHGSKAGT